MPERRMLNNESQRRGPDTFTEGQSADRDRRLVARDGALEEDTCAPESSLDQCLDFVKAT